MKKIFYQKSSDLPYTWKNESRLYGHNLHRICSRTGAFPPSLVYYFVTHHVKKSRGILVDPFCGKGTAPFEACCNGMIGVGNDLLPDAFILTYAKVKIPKIKSLNNEIKRLNVLMQRKIDKTDVPEYVRVFYHQKVMNELLTLRAILNPPELIEMLSANEDTEELRARCFIIATLLGLLHGSSKLSLSLPASHSYAMTPGHVKKYFKANLVERSKLYPSPDVLMNIKVKAETLLSYELPVHYTNGSAYNEDAIKFLRGIDDDSVDMILTSPPYLNKQTYAWDNRIRLWFLNYNYKDFKRNDDYLEVSSRDRYLRYMNLCINEMTRILIKDAKLIMILGDIDGLVEDVAQIIQNQDSYVEPLTIIEDEYANGRKSSVYSRNIKRMDKIIVATKR